LQPTGDGTFTQAAAPSNRAAAPGARPFAQANPQQPAAAGGALFGANNPMFGGLGGMMAGGGMNMNAMQQNVR
jgi:hypothetical protein